MIKFDVINFMTKKNKDNEWEIKDSLCVDKIQVQSESLAEVRKTLVERGYAMDGVKMEYKGDCIEVSIIYTGMPVGELRRK
jgi:hypothetical protein